MEKRTHRKTKENSRELCGRKTVVSGEHLVASIPLIRILDGVGIDVPTIIVPVDIRRAKHAVFIPDVEDIGVAIVQENTSFAILLLFHQGKHFRQGGFDFRLATLLGDDRVIDRGFFQPSVTQGLLANWFFDLSVIAQEALSEKIAEVADSSFRFAARIANKLLAG